MNAKTLHLTNAWHAQSGGIATFYRALLSAAQEHRREVVLLVPAGEDRLEEWNPYARIWHVRAPLAPLNRSYRLILPHRYLTASTHIQSILRREQPDLVEICDKYSLPYLAGLLRRNLVPGLRHRPALAGHSCERMDRNVEAYLTRGPAGRLLARLYMKWIYFAQFDHHLANSAHTAAELADAARGHLVPRGVWLMPPGVDTATFHPARRDEATRRRLLRMAGGNPDSVLLFYSGRLAPEKNLPLLPALLHLLTTAGDGPDYRLIIAGDGILRAQLEEQCRRLAPGATAFLGHIASRDELAGLLASADVFVHPNPHEPFGIAPLEAMAAGVPVVAPDTGGVRTYADPSTAWLAPARPHAFAQSVRQARRGEITVRARQRAEDYSWPRVTARCFELYDELCALTRALPGRGLRPAFSSTPGNWLGMEV
jgi:alpha-1,6-mannosyltransferase